MIMELLVYMALKNLLIKSKEDWDIIRHYNLGGIPTLLMKNIGKINQFWSKQSK